METRSVKIVLPGASAPQEIQSNASTWGNLQTELEDELNIDFNNTKVRNRNTNHHYDNSASELPSGPLQLLVSSDKNKSGSVTKANYHKVGFSDLRTFCKKITGFAPNGKQACIDALDKHYGKESPKAEAAPAKKGKTVKEVIKASPKSSSSDSSLKNTIAALEARVSALENADRGENLSANDDAFWD